MTILRYPFSNNFIYVRHAVSYRDLEHFFLAKSIARVFKGIQAGALRVDQMMFISNIITYLTENGSIGKKILFEPLPTNIHIHGLVDF
jgi:hypothetical protein